MRFEVAASRWTLKALIEAVLPAEATRRYQPLEVPSSPPYCATHPSTACWSKMKWKRIAVFVTLQVQLPLTGKAGFYLVRHSFKTFLR